MLTLIEAAKLVQNPLQRGVVEVIAASSPVLDKLPFMEVSGNAYQFNREETLPGADFRAINENYIESTGILDPQTEPLKVFGGTSRVDRALVKTQGNLNDLRAMQDAMKAKACALDFTRAFFKGDHLVNPRQFDGIQKRISGSQLLSAGSASGGDALTLAMLDELLDQVAGGADMLFMNKTMRRKTNALMRAAGQAIETVSDVFGRQIPTYAGIPIGVIEFDADGNEILGFNEANPGGGTPASTSIYACRFGVQEHVSGLQAGALEVIDNGLVGVWYETLIEWICSITVFNPRSAARLCGVKAA